MSFLHFIIWSTIVAIVLGQDAKPKNGIEENVLRLLTLWRSGESGAFAFPLPALAIITMPPVSGIYEGYGAMMTYSTDKLNIVGLKGFSVTQIDIVESSMKGAGRMVVPSITVDSDRYKIDGSVLRILPINGSGKMKIIMQIIELQMSIRLRNNSTRMWVDNLQFSFKLGAVNATLEGGPNSIATILNRYGPAIIQSYHQEIVDALTRVATPAIDNFFKSNGIVTTQQLLKLVEDL